MFDRDKERLRAYFAVVATGTFLIGCAAPPVQITPENSASVMAQFQAGQIQMSTKFPAKYNSNKQYMETLYQWKKWNQLASLVIESNSSIDLAWFYLGKSAEELGYRDAARTYYDKAMSDSLKYCAHQGGEECNGHVFPRDIVAHLKGLQGSAVTGSSADEHEPADKPNKLMGPIKGNGHNGIPAF